MKKMILFLLVTFATFLSGCESGDTRSVDVDPPLVQKEEEDEIKDEVTTMTEVTSSDSIYSYLTSLTGDFDTYYVNDTVNTDDYSRIDAIYEAHKSETLEAVIIVATVEGRWGPINFVFSINTVSNKIIDFSVFDSSEKWGSFISLDSFQDQFNDTELEFYSLNLFELGIDGNADATTTIGSLYAGLTQIISMYDANFK